MVRYVPLQSGSSGNGALLWDENVLFVLDVGVSSRFAKEALRKYNLTISSFDKVVILITHMHMDHAKYKDEWIGISKNIIAPFTLRRNNLNEIEFVNMGIPAKDKNVEWDTYKVEPFDVKHDVRNFGYKITMGSDVIVFMTDLSRIPLEPVKDFFKNATIYLVECNWNIFISPEFEYPRDEIIYHSNKTRHFSSLLADKFLKRNIGPNTEYVHFLHLSSKIDNWMILHEISKSLIKAHPHIKLGYLPYSKIPNNQDIAFEHHLNPFTSIKNKQGII